MRPQVVARVPVAGGLLEGGEKFVLQLNVVAREQMEGEGADLFEVVDLAFERADTALVVDKAAHGSLRDDCGTEATREAVSGPSEVARLDGAQWPPVKHAPPSHPRANNLGRRGAVSSPVSFVETWQTWHTGRLMK